MKLKIVNKPQTAVIGCKSRKQDYPCPAREMYEPSILFRSQLEFCETLGYENIYIMSLKYGLVKLDDVIEPYDLTLPFGTTTVSQNFITEEDKHTLAHKVASRLNEEGKEVHLHLSNGYANVIRKYLTIPYYQVKQKNQATVTTKYYQKGIDCYRGTGDVVKAFEAIEYRKPNRKLNEPKRTWYHPSGETFFGTHGELSKAKDEVNLGSAYNTMLTYIGDERLYEGRQVRHSQGWHLDPTLEFYEVGGKWRVKK